MSFTAVRNFVQACNKAGVVERKKRGTIKSGSNDPQSAWSTARRVFSQQLLDELANQKLNLDGIAWWDECHQQIKLGAVGDYQVRVRRDEKGLPSETGEFRTPLQPRVSVKFPGEARLLFGASHGGEEDKEETRRKYRKRSHRVPHM